ncbi:type 1 glutamine amidotransferase domain-containing protein [Komagataeibacter nataicola]|uniref:Type 1 glutamine amidotransferase domain-containing protein n=1 Tax=Komagataeibacter nataicola TaxID=265960 RepID=A0A9N7C6E3_9PROT|nr:type 1 glutamine amidotransferase domain-containing protein [Komagataeibacter nataicola]AQU86422.1 type 1 glutamine amidotransferase domain-containing protein [Komagataeibacter nataicola]PYD65303.1 type 1 glutamine amidotransferase domain-containing protein [Komagataeibacter nataicola]WEQ56684.1 type 1 glutamine amidotransferase domain-containing protein [Komagataeibacter nataicola]WNM08155.1 type 1 glutamine amidotransferase domain-containing protein [Komagataeibacter nataicola]GBR23634.1 
MSRHILHVATNITHFDNPMHPTGLWLSELTHAWDVFAARGYEQHIVSPRGGRVPLDPRALKWPMRDASAKAWLADPAKMALLSSTPCPADINPQDYDAIYFTGGHGVMWDFPDSEGLQAITRAVWEKGGIVSTVCHGYCGLLNTRLANGSFLVSGRKITGFSWTEERLAGVSREIPYNAEAEMKARGALYEKAFLPFMSHVVADGKLVTGQNPSSARATARKVASLLG